MIGRPPFACAANKNGQGTVEGVNLSLGGCRMEAGLPNLASLSGAEPDR